MSGLRKVGAVTYSLGSTIPGNLRRVALVSGGGVELVPWEVTNYANPSQIPADRYPVAAIPYAGETIPANLLQVRNTAAVLSYMDKVLALSPLAFWPLNESSGSQAADLSGHGYHGSYSGVTLAAADGPIAPYKAPSFDGVNDRVNLYSAALRNAFNPAEGSVFMWARVAEAGVWTDGTFRDLIALRADWSNYVSLSKHSSDNLITCGYSAGGTYAQLTYNPTTPDWFSIGFTWSKANNRIRLYVGGQQYSTTGLGTWAGTLGSTACVLGAQSTSGANWWSGLIGPVALFDRELTPAEVAALSTP